jgi:hypothetical protein
MSDVERDQVVAATGKTAAAVMDALQDDDVNEALQALAGWAITLRDRLTLFDIPDDSATGWVLGAVLAGMNVDRPDASR